MVDTDSLSEGDSLSIRLGASLGDPLGAGLGNLNGAELGDIEGWSEGDSLGIRLEASLDNTLGTSLGVPLGLFEGSNQLCDPSHNASLALLSTVSTRLLCISPIASQCCIFFRTYDIRSSSL